MWKAIMFLARRASMDATHPMNIMDCSDAAKIVWEVAKGVFLP